MTGKFSIFSLDLDKWINEPPSDSSDEEVTSTGIFVSVPDENRCVFCSVLIIISPEFVTLMMICVWSVKI